MVAVFRSVGRPQHLEGIRPKHTHGQVERCGPPPCFAPTKPNDVILLPVKRKHLPRQARDEHKKRAQVESEDVSAQELRCARALRAIYPHRTAAPPSSCTTREENASFKLN